MPCSRDLSVDGYTTRQKCVVESENDVVTTEILPKERRAGVCLHISALPGPYGIGDVGAGARAFVDAMVDMKLGVWQFLPIGPTASGDSPYQPLSTFAGNEMLIDIGDLIDLGLLSRYEVAELATLPGRHVDYGGLIPIKSRLLGLAASRFSAAADRALATEFDDFMSQHDSRWLHDYAVYRTLKSRHGERPWPEWHPQYVHREENALRSLEQTEADQIAALKIGQFLFFRQWRSLRDYAHERKVLLFGDMPICIALDSADAWANRHVLRLDRDGKPDRVAGVPPDYFSEDGQLWGNPLYDWEHHAANNYEWWIERLRATVELMDLVRIDHFRGFESYWSVPAHSDTARTGVWEPGPGDAIFDAMQEALGHLPIVAEDLGVITPEVEALRDRHKIPGMHVLQFDVCDPDFRLSDVTENSVCYTGTHDNDTTVGWFRGGPGDMRSAEDIKHDQDAALAMTNGTRETIHRDLIRTAFSTDARLAIAPLQDYLGLGSEARFNIPGTAGGNWRWRVLDAQISDEICDNIASMVIASGRGIPRNGR